MADVSEMNTLVSNIIDEKHYSHCRLCLKSIESGNYAKFGDSVDYSGSNKFTALSDLIEKLLDAQVLTFYLPIATNLLQGLGLTWIT